MSEFEAQQIDLENLLSAVRQAHSQGRTAQAESRRLIAESRELRTDHAQRLGSLQAGFRRENDPSSRFI